LLHDKSREEAIRTEWFHLNIGKIIYKKPTVNTILNGQKLKSFPQVRNETMVSTFHTLIKYSSGIPSQSNKKRERNKWTQIGKEVPVCQ
jgi:hypothetical protein